MMDTKICISTEVIFDFLIGEENAVQKIKLYSNEDLCMTSLTLFELRSVAEKQERISELLGYFTILDFDSHAAEIAAHIVRNDLHYGINRNTKSVINAAICITNNSLLFTKNRANFEGIKNIKLI
ncbi:MAG: type II toxin-antitoxin system VapC family toxin [Candidatus Micrarchaeota archaeon]